MFHHIIITGWNDHIIYNPNLDHFENEDAINNWQIHNLYFFKQI